MRLIALAAVVAFLCTGCSDNPGGEPDSEVHLHVGASNYNPEVGDIVVLNADTTTKGRVYFISFSWITLRGPDAPIFGNSLNTLTNVRFTEPGEYRIAMRIYWWDIDNDRRTTESSVVVVVDPAPPVGPG